VPVQDEMQKRDRGSHRSTFLLLHITKWQGRAEVIRQ